MAGTNYYDSFFSASSVSYVEVKTLKDSSLSLKKKVYICNYQTRRSEDDAALITLCLSFYCVSSFQLSSSVQHVYLRTKAQIPKIIKKEKRVTSDQKYLIKGRKRNIPVQRKRERRATHPPPSARSSSNNTSRLSYARWNREKKTKKKTKENEASPKKEARKGRGRWK